MQWNVNGKDEFREVVLSTSVKIQQKLLMEGARQTVVRTLDQWQHFIGNGFLLSDTTTAPFTGQVNFRAPCLSTETRRKDNSVRCATPDLFLLKITATIGAILNPRANSAKLRQGI